MGLYVYVYRSDYDCTLNYFYGAKEIFIANAEGPFTLRDGDKAGLIVPNTRGTVSIVPAKLEAGEWVPITGGMFGGTYATTSDSRFSNKVEQVLGHKLYGAISVHDRFEAN